MHARLVPIAVPMKGTQQWTERTLRSLLRNRRVTGVQIG